MESYYSQRGTTPQAEAARRLTLWGFDVGPLGKWKYDDNGRRLYVERFDEKAPLPPRGFRAFTASITQVSRWWAMWPTANVGARPWDWAVVLDVDVRSGGLDTWRDLNKGHELPTTLVTKTGSGGYHYWYALPYPGALNGKAGPGIDIKHHGGCLVMPGSIHPDTGLSYNCTSWVNPENIPDLPAHLRRHVYQPARVKPPSLPLAYQRQGDGSHLVQRLLDAPPGTRNDTLNDTVFQAVLFGYDVVDQLEDAAHAIGLVQDEGLASVHNTITSATNGARRKGAA